MSMDQFLQFLEIVIWPVVVLIAIFIIRPHLSALFSGAKVRLSIAGQSIETTLPEMKQILEEQVVEHLTDEHVAFLTSLQKDGARQYSPGIKESDERKFLRPLRNLGFIRTVPRNSFLSYAQAIELSGLGRLYLRARTTDLKKDA